MHFCYPRVPAPPPSPQEMRDESARQQSKLSWSEGPSDPFGAGAGEDLETRSEGVGGDGSRGQAFGKSGVRYLLTVFLSGLRSVAKVSSVPLWQRLVKLSDLLAGQRQTRRERVEREREERERRERPWLSFFVQPIYSKWWKSSNTERQEELAVTIEDYFCIGSAGLSAIHLSRWLCPSDTEEWASALLNVWHKSTSVTICSVMAIVALHDQGNNNC